jgi:hypothetical protein
MAAQCFTGSSRLKSSKYCVQILVKWHVNFSYRNPRVQPENEGLGPGPVQPNRENPSTVGDAHQGTGYIPRDAAHLAKGKGRMFKSKKQRSSLGVILPLLKWSAYLKQAIYIQRWGWLTMNAYLPTVTVSD